MTTTTPIDQQISDFLPILREFPMSVFGGAHEPLVTAHIDSSTGRDPLMVTFEELGTVQIALEDGNVLVIDIGQLETMLQMDTKAWKLLEDWRASKTGRLLSGDDHA